MLFCYDYDILPQINKFCCENNKNTKKIVKRGKATLFSVCGQKGKLSTGGSLDSRGRAAPILARTLQPRRSDRQLKTSLSFPSPLLVKYIFRAGHIVENLSHTLKISSPQALTRCLSRSRLTRWPRRPRGQPI